MHKSQKVNRKATFPDCAVHPLRGGNVCPANRIYTHFITLDYVTLILGKVLPDFCRRRMTCDKFPLGAAIVVVIFVCLLLI